MLSIEESSLYVVYIKFTSIRKILYKFSILFNRKEQNIFTSNNFLFLLRNDLELEAWVQNNLLFYQQSKTGLWDTLFSLEF